MAGVLDNSVGLAGRGRAIPIKSLQLLSMFAGYPAPMIAPVKIIRFRANDHAKIAGRKLP